jgi:hypothetical protein
MTAIEELPGWGRGGTPPTHHLPKMYIDRGVVLYFLGGSYVTLLKSYISYFGKFRRHMNSYVSGPTTYPISIPHPLPNAP